MNYSFSIWVVLSRLLRRQLPHDRRLGQPTDAQQQAWEAIVAILHMVRRPFRCGTSARDLFEQAKTLLDAHHTARRLSPSPRPRLRPVYLKPPPQPPLERHVPGGDTFTAEPGLYADDLQSGDKTGAGLFRDGRWCRTTDPDFSLRLSHRPIHDDLFV
ncbi:MAG: hypothetical protein R3C02_04805 [Planctomycetaceae bacterium]